MQRKRRHQIRNIRRARLDYQVGSVHRPPKFGLDRQARQAGRAQCLDQQMVDAKMGLVPVVVVGEENYRRTMLRQKRGDHLDRRRPAPRVLLSLGRVDPVQSPFSRANQPEADIIAAVLKLAPAFRLAIDAAAQGDCHIHDVHFQFTQQSQR